MDFEFGRSEGRRMRPNDVPWDGIILAAPLVLDLARWVAILQIAGRSGPIPKLSFYFKKAVGDSPPQTFQDQVAGLLSLKRECDENIKQ